MPGKEFGESWDAGTARIGTFNFMNKFDFAIPSPKENASVDSIPGMAPIKGLDAPDGWSREITECGLDRTSCSVSFTPPDGSDSTLSFYDRGFPVVGSGGEKFRQLINKPPHMLNADEIEQLSEQVIGPLADKSAFTITRAETQELNGKRVLTIDGDWSSGKAFHGYFIPAPENRIREMYFEGDKPAFIQHLQSAIDSMRSIQWMPEAKSK